ncbi:hypothetical protein [Microvirga pakistanensis]|uniref:hypothetical protein n=1 Tax=Microvirga pakistanensis TaxID=1682650 RepID=UPI00106A8C9D|nr:hypothetical protein [Microvirga pakistanensis]
MPLSQNPIVEWPAEFEHLVQSLQISADADSTRNGHIDVDVDAETLFRLNVFEARMRHRRVRLRVPGTDECLVAEMNVLVGLGAADNPGRRSAKVRISFHDIQEDGCVDPVPSDEAALFVHPG